MTKLDSSGNMIYSTYLGGSGSSAVSAIVVDAAGNAYVTGTTGSPDFPTTKGAYSTTSGGSFVSKFNPDGSLAYSTLFPEAVSALAVDSSGAAYITGSTDSSLPVTPGAYLNSCSFCGISFVARCFLHKYGRLPHEVRSQRLDADLFDISGSGKAEYPTSLALASDGSAYVPTGATISHMNGTGSSMLGTGSTQLGIQTMAVAPDGSVYAAGSTVNTKFTATAGGFPNASAHRRRCRRIRSRMAQGSRSWTRNFKTPLPRPTLEAPTPSRFAR